MTIQKREKERLIRELTKELQEENLAIFAGAGLSIPAGFVNWKELLKPIADDLNLDIEKEASDLISLAQYHYNANQSNRSKLNQLLIANFCKKEANPTINHRILARLPVSIYWTTNYDNLIESSLKEAGKIPDVKYTNQQLAFTKPRRDVVVYKMHGDVEHPDKAILTKDDYERYHLDMQPFLNALSGDLVSKTFLFIGFSFSDPNLDYILSRVRIHYQKNQRQHFCLLRKVDRNECEDNADFEYKERKQDFFVQDLLRFGVRSVLVDEYKEITEILENLEKQYRRNTIFVSGAAHDYSPHTQDESCQFVFNLTKSIIEDGYNIVSGFGLGIGSSVITGALEHIYMSGGNIRNGQLVLRPFPQTQTGATKDLKQIWRDYRNDMLSFSGIAIFVFGNKQTDTDELILSNGMREEFEIAKSKGLFLLPIGATGYIAKELWNEVNENFEEYNGAVSSEIKEKFSLLGKEKLTFEEMYEHVMHILMLLKT